MAYGNYLQGSVDSTNNAYNVLLSGAPSGYTSSGLNIGGDTSTMYGVKLSKDSTNNAFLDLRADLSNKMSLRYKDNTSGTLSSMLDLFNDSALSSTSSYGATVNGRVKASSYYVGSVDTRAPVNTGVYQGYDGNVGYFNINKGSGSGGFSFKTYNADGSLLQSNLNLLASGVIQAAYYTATGNAADFETIAIAGMDASGNFVVVWESPDVDQLGVYAQRFLADGPVQLLGSVLQISGSSLADTITVTSVAGATVSLNVVLNGVVFPFAPSRVSGIIINALAGHDVVTVNSNVLLPTMIDGGAGDDTLTGGAGDDQLTGADGSDTLAGRSGKDTYVFAAASVAESDTLAEAADDGTDTLNFAFLASSVVVNLASTSIQPVHTNRTLKLNSASVFENIVGGSGADTLFGNGLDNTLSGNAGNDKLLGAGGNDLLYGGADNDTYMFVPTTVAEADTVSENLNQGIDTLSFGYLTIGVVVNLGSTSVQPVHANRTLKLNSAVVFENLDGGSGADTLFGNTLNNTLIGGAGDDKLLGSSGSDKLLGGANNDTYMFVPTATAEADQVTENANEGTDTLNFAYLTSSVVLNLGSTSIQPVNLNRTLRLNSLSTFENAVGGTGSDTLLGNTVANRLTGGLGDNILVGMEGGDILEAGSGRDILIGGLGLDILKGDAGDDILIAGRTTSDTSLSNLSTLRTQWISGNAYAARITNLRAGVGGPLVSLKTSINVLKDAGEDDVLFGGTDTDWFFRAVDDVITDLFAGETIEVL